MTDLYTRCALTVIAAALVVMASGGSILQTPASPALETSSVGQQPLVVLSVGNANARGLCYTKLELNGEVVADARNL